MHPGFAISIKKMMMFFKGWSNMTHHMKYKLIKEGFKFYAMCDVATGFIYFFLSERLKEKKKKNSSEKVCRLVCPLPGRSKR